MKYDKYFQTSFLEKLSTEERIEMKLIYELFEKCEKLEKEIAKLSKKIEQKRGDK